MPAPEVPPAPIRFEIAVDARAQFANSFEPGLGVTLSGGRRLAGFLELSTALPRSVALGVGHVSWLRIALGIGARYRAELGPLYLEPALSVEGAYLRATGDGFPVSSTDTGLDASACGQLRLGRQLLDALGLYLGVRGCAWPLGNRLGATAVSETVAMPVFEVTAMLGITAGYALKGSGDSKPLLP